jgi:starch phosphorylase
VTDLAQLRRILPLAEDAAFRSGFGLAKRKAKARFVDWVAKELDRRIDPDSLFDCQIKRFHEYKRELLNVLHIVILYNRLRAHPGLDLAPRTFLFAGKAAPAYRLAKLIIKFINSVGTVLDSDPLTRGRLTVVFLPDYSVSLSELLIPASDVSEQISTAGYEASGTSNMKFMMNGALTVGTRDGATIEMAEEAGAHNLFLFGLTADQVAASRGWYSPWWHYHNEAATRDALDLIARDHFSPDEPGLFYPIWEMLLPKGDFYRHLADLGDYARAQSEVDCLYRNTDAWNRRAILNVGASGKFSSDRSISEYAEQLWHARPCPVEAGGTD